MFIVFCIPTVTLGGPRDTKNWCIVIDAGHGGKDPGTVSGRNYEKTINLAIALELGRELERRVDGIKVVYTRNDDRFIALSDRSKIANSASGDLFISIHTNSSTNKSASGTETFVMGVDKGSANLAVAMRENGVVSLEADYKTTYEGYDPNDSESFIMFSLMQYSYQTQSLELARLTQNKYKERELSSRGVKQSGFLVLWHTAMPSILTEVGFLSNDADARHMTSAAGQRSIAHALAESVESYMKNNPKIDLSTIKPTQSTLEQNRIPDTITSHASQGKVSYSVQIKSSSTRLPINATNFGPYVIRIWERKVKNVYKYYVDRVISYKEALLLQGKLRDNYRDAFVVAFSGKEQIEVKDAKKITEK